MLLGTDFPNIPHPCAHLPAALARTGLDDGWLRNVGWHNGARRFGLGPDVSAT